MAGIKLKMSWYEMLGEDSNEYEPDVRRDRWKKWKELARQNGDADLVEYWSDSSACGECLHRDGDWCDLMELPATINPVLTMSGGMLGFACMGGGREKPGQKEIDFAVADEDLPF